MHLHHRLITIARQTLNDFLDPSIPLFTNQYRQHFSDKQTDARALAVFVQIRSNGQIKAQGCSYHHSTERAVQEATVHALEVPMNGRPLLLKEATTATIELWIKVEQQAIEPPFTNLSGSLEYFAHGLTLSVYGDQHELLPSTIITEGLKTTEDQLDHLFHTAQIETDQRQSPGIHLYVSKWNNIVEAPESKDGHYSFKRLRFNRTPAVSLQSMQKAALASTRRLISQQLLTGSYTYEYNALHDKTGDAEKFNMVRMAGTAFSVAMISGLLSTGHDQQAAEASATQAFKFLFSHAKPYDQVPESLFIAQDHDYTYGKLGSTALTLLGLQFGSFYANYVDQRKALIQTILGMQEEDGSFRCHIGYRKSSKSSQNYFPGEALLALCYELKHAPDQEIMESIIRSFPYYQNHFATEPHTAFVLWQVSAWALFYELMESSMEVQSACNTHGLTKERVAQFIYDQTDWILKLQHTEETTNISAYVGGFPNTGNPHSVSSCYLEAVIRATGIAHLDGNQMRFEQYRHASIIGLEFLMRLQLQPEEQHLFPNSEQSIGGISGTLTSFQLRSDRDQHAITAFIAAIETPSLFSTKLTSEPESIPATV